MRRRHGRTCRVRAHQLIPIPEGVSFAQAASLPVAYGTAHRMMFENGNVKAGEKMLVLGASGGVGTCCVLLGKKMGMEVIACAGSQDKLDRLKEMGSDHVLNYNEVDFRKEINEMYGKPHRRTYDGGVDVVVNFTGGDTWVNSFKCMNAATAADVWCHSRFRSENGHSLYLDFRTRFAVRTAGRKKI